MLKQCEIRTRAYWYKHLRGLQNVWRNAPSLIHTEFFELRICLCGQPFQQEWYNETYYTAIWYQMNRNGEGTPSFSNEIVLFQKCLKITD